jgi:hypothetical protein
MINQNIPSNPQEPAFKVEKQIQFSRPLNPDLVLKYLNMIHDGEWWPEVIYVRQLTEEEVGVGTEFEEQSKIWGPITTTVHATVIEYGENEDGDYILRLHGEGTGLSYEHCYAYDPQAGTLTWRSEVFLPRLLTVGIILKRIEAAIDNQLETNLPLLSAFIEKKINAEESGEG